MFDVSATFFVVKRSAGDQLRKLLNRQDLSERDLRSRLIAAMRWSILIERFAGDTGPTCVYRTNFHGVGIVRIRVVDKRHFDGSPTLAHDGVKHVGIITNVEIEDS